MAPEKRDPRSSELRLDSKQPKTPERNRRPTTSNRSQKRAIEVDAAEASSDGGVPVERIERRDAEDALEFESQALLEFENEARLQAIIKVVGVGGAAATPSTR